MSLCHMNSFLGVPANLRTSHIYEELSPKNLLSLERVNKQLNQEITSLYKKYCFEKIPLLDRFSSIYQPLVDLQEKPWKLIFLSYHDKKGRRKGDLAAQISKSTLPLFRKLLENQISTDEQAKVKLKGELRDLCGDYYQDPNSRIHQAWIEADTALTSGEIEEYTALETYVDEILEERGIDYVVYIQNIHSEAEQNNISYTEALKDHDVDVKIIRFTELCGKKFPPKNKFENLQAKQEMSLSSIHTIEKRLSHIDLILNDPSLCKAYSEEIIYHILYLLPYLPNAFISQPQLNDIMKDIFRARSEAAVEEEPSKELIDQIRNKINGLPLRVSTKIWKLLYLYCGKGVIEERWSEHHFHEELGMLNTVINCSCDFEQDAKFDYNPVSHFIDECFISTKNITFKYPTN